VRDCHLAEFCLPGSEDDADACLQKACGIEYYASISDETEVLRTNHVARHPNRFSIGGAGWFACVQVSRLVAASSMTRLLVYSSGGIIRG
jgi:hypothetical protein